MRWDLSVIGLRGKNSYPRVSLKKGFSINIFLTTIFSVLEVSPLWILYWFKLQLSVFITTIVHENYITLFKLCIYYKKGVWG